MRRFAFITIFTIALCAFPARYASAADWSLHFGIFQYPGLNAMQRADMRIRELQGEIEKLERSIAEKRVEIERIAAATVRCREKSLFCLGLYGRDTRIEDRVLVYDEKSVFWGAIKWGKRRP